MLFGDYLIEKNVITESQLLEGLLEQIERTPSYAMACYQGKLLSAHDLLLVLKEQQKKSTDFFSAAKSLQLWTDNKTVELLDILNVQRRPLGEILVEKGFIQLRELTLYLDEFLADFPQKEDALVQSNEPNDSLKEEPNSGDLKSLGDEGIDPHILSSIANSVSHLSLLSEDEGFLFDSLVLELKNNWKSMADSFLSREEPLASEVAIEVVRLLEETLQDGFLMVHPKLPVIAEKIQLAFDGLVNGPVDSSTLEGLKLDLIDKSQAS